jgi:hypothetical protein
LDITEADIQGTYELSSIVRDTVTRMITIENPLNKDVIFNEENIKFDEDINLEIKPIPFKIKKDAVNYLLTNPYFFFRKETSKLNTDH